MAVELKDVQEVAEALGKKFDEFKSVNDKRVEGVEQEKAKLSGQVDKLNEKLTELETFKKNLEAELLALKRPGGGSTNPDVTAHKAAFGQFVRKGVDSGLAELQQKALQIGVEADGGYAVPEELDRTIVELLTDENPMRRVCGQITIGTPNYRKVVNLGGAKSGWVGETDERGETATPKLSIIEPVMGEIYANPFATQTSLDDIFFNAEAWLTEEVIKEFVEQEGLAFLSGNGDKKPKGVLSYSFSEAGDKARAFGTLQKLSAAAISGDVLIDLIHSARKGYRANGLFMFNSLTLASIRKLKDSQGNYLWVPGLEAGKSSQILGYGYEENEDMPDVAAGAKPILFGDFKRGYLIVDRIGTRVLRDPYSNKPYVGFYTTKRVGGMLQDSRAIKALEIAGGAGGGDEGSGEEGSGD